MSRIGKMYHPKNWSAMEYIVIEELNHTVALMAVVTQEILWITKNTLQYQYKEKKPKEE